ncbi:hypothetical protein IWW45_007285 [Coemansia sp. RSA 485]|nr:hypothetical protein IWW45_007285 [Coemansia sp. RSA 485]
MLFHKLPTVVQKLILRYCVDSTGDKKQKLVFLSVCHEWRKLAKPAFYTFAYHIEKQEDDSSSDHEEHTRTQSDPVTWSSNIELVCYVGAFRSIRQIYVELKTIAGLQIFVQGVSSIFALDGREWTGVKNLELCVPRDLEQQFRQSDNFQADYRLFREETVPSLVNTLSKGMPNIWRLDLVSGNDDCCATVLGTRLVVPYSESLRALTGVSPINFGLIPAFPHITIIDAALDSSAAQILPLINPLMVRFIRLHNVTRRFSWSCFDYHNTNKSVRFPNLSTLFLSFVKDGPNADNDNSNTNENMDVSFPKLNSLFVMDFPKNHSLFTNCTFSDKMHNLLLSDGLQAIQPGSFNTNAFIGNITVTIANEAIDNQTYQALNHLFGSSIKNTECRLSVLQSFDLNVDLVFWPKLQDITLKTVYFADFVALLSKMPALQYFYATEVFFDTTLPDGTRFDPEKFVLTESTPLDSQVHNVAFMFFVNLDSGTTLRCIQTLLKRLGNLTKFSTGENVVKTLESFVNDNKQNYPHFSKLRCKVSY